ncbi:bifunctional phosphoribosylaminoimidazolecarboxamide formyltransferase/IMP cyclohydrolase [bacterium]|nr:bifunctional phosphoribosylaminoimidazolecarboxamide formyltransferase/IMP cyclohydrolase [bacterium]
MKKVTRALISVSDKTGIVDFAGELSKMGVEILSTGGTAKELQSAGIKITLVSDYTGFPEMFDGRVKTLHPKIHAGLLAVRDNKSHQDDLKKHSIPEIDMVVVNLYPFYDTVKRAGISQDEVIENIDIGGPTMLRSAAKNFKYVVCICNPNRYNDVSEEMKNNDGCVSAELKKSLAAEVFRVTSTYDSIISNYFLSVEDNPELPDEFAIPLKKIQGLRYGENPHQRASFYKLTTDGRSALTDTVQLQGKELSYNNIVDFDSAYRIILEFTKPAAIVIKHNNPCGAAEADNLFDAYKRARATDPMSAFGSIQAFNGKVEDDLAKEITSTFVEGVIAPDYTEGALEIFSKKKNLRILKKSISQSIPALNFYYDVKRVLGGILVQDWDAKIVSENELKCVTEKKPAEKEIDSLMFAWKIVKHVKSNAIIFVSGTETVGIGAGQMSRIDSTQLASLKARKPLENIVMASDAFFPFRDNIDEAAKHGVKAIIQPGGSIRDQEVIDACNEYAIAMVFTGMRHFKH